MNSYLRTKGKRLCSLKSACSSISNEGILVDPMIEMNEFPNRRTLPNKMINLVSFQCYDRFDNFHFLYLSSVISNLEVKMFCREQHLASTNADTEVCEV